MPDLNYDFKDIEAGTSGLFAVRAKLFNIPLASVDDPQGLPRQAVEMAFLTVAKHGTPLVGKLDYWPFTRPIRAVSIPRSDAKFAESRPSLASYVMPHIREALGNMYEASVSESNER